MKALSFDFGQTLAEFDYDFLAVRLAERGVTLDAAGARQHSQAAWDLYGKRKAEGHAQAWRAMIEHHLEGGGVPRESVGKLGAWLWDEQPRKNLWRRPIAGMIELVRELVENGVAIAIISNSEGHLEELVRELGWSDAFRVVVDSGRVGVEKPDPRIFAHACAALGAAPHELLHVGDAWEADVQGALRASASAVWFDSRHAERALPNRVYGAANAVELREVLARLGFVS